MKSHVFLFFKSVYDSFSRNRCNVNAAGLTYFSILAVVPLLCLVLLCAKTLGAGDFARRELNGYIDRSIASFEKDQNALPAFITAAASPEMRDAKRKAAEDFVLQARTVSNELFDRVDRFRVGTLGWIGCLILCWTVVSTFGIVEDSFNRLCGVTEPRPLWKRVVLYLLVALALPLPVAAALALPIGHGIVRVIDATAGAAAATKALGDFLIAVVRSRALGFAMTFGCASIAFSSLFKFMPKRPILNRAALEGGCLTTLAFMGWLKLCTVAQVGIVNSSALYGSFAFLPIVLAWLYVSWQIVLFGCALTYAFDCHHRRLRGLDV